MKQDEATIEQLGRDAADLLTAGETYGVEDAVAQVLAPAEVVAEVVAEVDAVTIATGRALHGEAGARLAGVFLDRWVDDADLAELFDELASGSTWLLVEVDQGGDGARSMLSLHETAGDAAVWSAAEVPDGWWPVELVELTTGQRSVPRVTVSVEWAPGVGGVA